jgi:hypothetical protein
MGPIPLLPHTPTWLYCIVLLGQKLSRYTFLIRTDWCQYLDRIFAGMLYRCIKYTENYETVLPLVILHFGVLEYFVSIKRWAKPRNQLILTDVIL